MKLFCLIEGLFYFLLLFRLVYGFVPLLESLSLELSNIFELIFYSLPANIATTAPISFAIAIFFCIRDISTNNEAVALQSFGSSLNVFLRPIVYQSFFVAAIVLFFAFQINPWLAYKSEQLKVEWTEKYRKLILNPNSINQIAGNMIFFQELQDDNYQSFFYFPANSDSIKQILTSQATRIDISVPNQVQLFLESGSLLSLNIEQEQNQEILFEQAQTNFDTASLQTEDGAQQNFSKTELANFAQKDLDNLKKKPNRLLNFDDLWILISQNPDPESRLEAQVEFLDRLLYHSTFIPFGLIAFSLGFQNPRFPKKGGVFSLLLSIALYYQFAGFAKKSSINNLFPVFTMAAPWLFLFILGVVLFQFSKRNKNLF